MNNFRQYVPSPVRRCAKIALYSCIDIYQSITGTRKPLTPPAMTSLLVGAGDFETIGNMIKFELIETTRLNKNSIILEIGCGYGRVAVALTDLHCSPGRYDGVEIVKKAVEWCTKEITSRYPNFRFHHADVSNPYAGRKNSRLASKYRLPFEDNTYDVVYLTSVFSHMRPNDIRAYLNEVSRVMKHHEKCFITYYLIDDFAVSQISSKRVSRDFCHDFVDFLSTNKRIPEQTIAVSESLIKSFYKKAGLVIDEPILHGSWSNREKYFSFQDAIVATKLSH